MMAGRPNVLLLCADMFGAANVGCYGDRSGATPNIDRLASAGVRFDRAYCACPPCIPARVSMMSGQYARTHGKLAHIKMPLQPQPVLIPQLLAELGYRTGIVGKTHWWPPHSDLGCDEAHLTIDTHLMPELGGNDAYLRFLQQHGRFRYDLASWEQDRPRQSTVAI